MRALYVTTSWLEVDSVDEAVDVAADIDRAVDLNFRAVLERHDFDEADVAAIVGMPETHWRIIK